MKLKIFYGWWIVVAAFVSLFIACGIGFAHFGIVLKEYIKEFGWSRATISGANSVYHIMTGIIGPLVGWASDKYGSQRVMICGAIIMGTSFILLHRMTSIWQLYVFYSILGVGWAGMTVIPSTTAVMHWFIKRRGLAISITLSGLPLGTTVFAPIIKHLIYTLDWRQAFLILGITVWIGTIPIVALLMKGKPEDIGLLPDGEKIEKKREVFIASEVSNSTHSESVRIATVLKTLRFWMLAIVEFLFHLSFLAILVHLFSYATDMGLTASVAAWAVSFNSFMMIPGRILFGFLADKFNKRYIIMICFFLQALGTFLLMEANSVAELFASLVLFGLGEGGGVSIIPLIVGDCFGLASFGEIYGWLHIPLMLGSSGGPFLAGYIFDLTQSYYWAFIVFIVAFMICAGAILFARVPEPLLTQKIDTFPHGDFL